MRANVSLIAAFAALAAWPAVAQSTGGGTPSLSFSFANGKVQVQDGTVERVTVASVEGNPANLGIESVPVANWIDLDDEAVMTSRLAIDAADVIPAGDERAYNFTLPAPVLVSYSAANGWSYSATGTCSFLRTYLDDGGTGASITVDNVPFTQYDVIVYLATDIADTSFLPVSVNGTNYIGTASGSAGSNASATWGNTGRDTVSLGSNALRVSGLTTQTLTIEGSSNASGSGARCGIAAFQIVQAAGGELREPDASSDHIISVNMRGSEKSIVGTSGKSGLEPVWNAFWNELSASGASETSYALVDERGVATSLSVSATYSGVLWRYDSAGRETLGDMANGYREITTLDLSGVPYSEYTLILYYASDLNNATPWAAVKVTSADDGAVKYYTYPADYSGEGAAVALDDASAAVDWGAASSLSSAEDSVAYGKAIMRIEGLSDDITLEMMKDSANRGALYGFQIVCTGTLRDDVVPFEPNPTISVNFARGRSGGDPLVRDVTDVETQALAVVSPDAWANLYPSSTDCDDTVTLDTIWNADLKVPVRVSYQANGTWSHDAEGRPAFLKTFLGDAAYGNKTGADILVSQIPFSEYKVIVYLATDSTSADFLPVEINGDLYKGNGTDDTVTASSATETFGDPSVGTPTEGVNTLCVEGLYGDLRIRGSTQLSSGESLSGRCNIAAFQIVCTGTLVDPKGPDRGVISLNFASGTNNAAVPDTAQLYGLEAVPGTAWADLTGAPASTQTFSVAYGAKIGTMSTTFSAGTTYWYEASQAVNPFMRGYLDDSTGNNGYNHVSIDVPDIPFAFYDVIVYLAVEQSDQDFKPVEVNGVYYTFDDATNGDWRTEAVEAGGASFGQGNQPLAEIGVNAIRVDRQNATALSVNGQSGSGGHRGGIAAIQIIERPLQEISVAAPTTAQEVFAQTRPGRATKVVFRDGGTITGDVTLPADTILDFSGYTFGGAAPISGTLAMDGGTIRLPETFVSAQIADSITGSFNCLLGDDPVWLTNQDGTLLLSYAWTGTGGDNRWSNPLNWSSNRVPDANAKVLFHPGGTHPETVILDTAATVATVTITGSGSGTADLTLSGAGSLTVSGQMLTTGNVAVTQSADITVQGESTMGSGDSLPSSLVASAGFQVNGSAASYTVNSGRLSVTHDVSVSNGGTLTVGTGGALTAARAIYSYYGESFGAISGTLDIAGQAAFTSGVSLNSGSIAMALAGGTVTTPTLKLAKTLTVSEDSTLAIPKAGTMAVTVSVDSSVLAGTGGLALSGSGTVDFDTKQIATTDYSGTLTVGNGVTLTLADNQRPNLAVESGAAVTITPTTDERTNGRITFGTSMESLPEEGATFSVTGVTEPVTASVVENDNGQLQLILSWPVKFPTLSATGDWTTGSWTNLDEGASYPTSGTAILDGSGDGGITVRLDTGLSGMDSIVVRGDVTLVTTDDAQATIPACVELEDGAILTIGANFSGAWTLPAGRTLRVTDAFSAFSSLTLNGAVEIATGIAAETISASVAFDGGLTVEASNLTLTNMNNVGVILALNGSGIRVEGDIASFYTDNGTQVVNTGSGNAITNVTGLNGTLAVESGTLALTLASTPNTAFSGATIAEGATLTLAANGSGWWFPATGAGTLALKGDFRPTFSAVSAEAATTPAIIEATATATEQTDGLISFPNYQNVVSFPDGFKARITPYVDAAPWVTVTQKGGNTLRILNVPPPSRGGPYSDEAELALRQAAAKAGITGGDYTVQVKTGGQTLPAPGADLVNGVLGCFAITPVGDATGTGTVTLAYEFGIAGLAASDGTLTVTVGVGGDGVAFKPGTTVSVVRGTEVLGSATVGEDPGTTVTVSIPESGLTGAAVLGVRVSDETPADPAP